MTVESYIILELTDDCQDPLPKAFGSSDHQGQEPLKKRKKDDDEEQYRRIAQEGTDCVRQSLNVHKNAFPERPPQEDAGWLEAGGDYFLAFWSRGSHRCH